MILLNIKINNCYNFVDFELNLSYPKRIAYSTIENECLSGHPNFRYKKAVILMGSNATGKTCLGRVIKNVVNLVNEGNVSSFLSMSDDSSSNVEIEFINGTCDLFRLNVNADDNKISTKLEKATILTKDSYESAKERFKEVYSGSDLQLLKENIGTHNCVFAYPEIEKSLKTTSINDDDFVKILKSVLTTLDPSLNNISISKELNNTIIIKRSKQEIIIQDGKLLGRELLSSGTIEGVDISLFLTSMLSKEKNFYYCDEHFSYVHSEIEKRIFQIMLSKLKDNEQLIFTTHNLDMLDLNLPKHTFVFLRRNEDGYSETISASSLLKRNTDSVRCAVENDVFGTLPNISYLDELEEINGE